MKQSTVIFGTITFCFVIYITLRGQLPAYLNLFRHNATTATPTPNSSGGVATMPGQVTTTPAGPPVSSFPYPIPNWGRGEWVN